MHAEGSDTHVESIASTTIKSNGPQKRCHACHLGGSLHVLCFLWPHPRRHPSHPDPERGRFRSSPDQTPMVDGRRLAVDRGSLEPGDLGPRGDSIDRDVGSSNKTVDWDGRVRSGFSQVESHEIKLRQGARGGVRSKAESTGSGVIAWPYSLISRDECTSWLNTRFLVLTCLGFMGLKNLAI